MINETKLKKAVELNITKELDEYEYRGDDGDYTPNENEKILMMDFMMGILEKLKPLFDLAELHNDEVKLLQLALTNANKAIGNQAEEFKNILKDYIHKSKLLDIWLSGYERGHDDTVESCYGNKEEKAIESIDAIINRQAEKMGESND